MMKMHAWMAACAVALLPFSAAGQDAKKWKPYQFAGNERYEFKIVSRDGDVVIRLTAVADQLHVSEPLEEHCGAEAWRAPNAAAPGFTC